MIFLAEERQALHVAGPEPHERLAGLELQIDLVAHESAQPINLCAVVGGGANTRIDAATCWCRLCPCASGQEEERRQRTRQTKAARRAERVRAHRAASPRTSGSVRKSMILNPSGFQRRVFGSFAASPYAY